MARAQPFSGPSPEGRRTSSSGPVSTEAAGSSSRPHTADELLVDRPRPTPADGRRPPASRRYITQVAKYRPGGANTSRRVLLAISRNRGNCSRGRQPIQRSRGRHLKAPDCQPMLCRSKGTPDSELGRTLIGARQPEGHVFDRGGQDELIFPCRRDDPGAIPPGKERWPCPSMGNDWDVREGCPYGDAAGLEDA